MDLLTIYRFSVIAIISGLALIVVLVVAPLCVAIAARRHQRENNISEQHHDQASGD
jgi:hypothetical protein